MKSRTARSATSGPLRSIALPAVLLALSAPIAGEALASPGIGATTMPHSAELRDAIARRADSGLRDFYTARGNQPLWVNGSTPSPAAWGLVDKLRTARLDGLDPGKLKVRELERALAKAQGGVAADLAKAELLLSKAYAAYVMAIRGVDRSGMIYENAALRPAVPAARSALETAAAAPDLIRYVNQMDWMHSLYQPLRQALNEPRWNERERRQIWTNLDRVRALPAHAAKRYVLVDAAGAKLWMYENGRPVDSMNVVVGKTDNPTPMMAGFIRYAIVNPYWNVPADLVRSRVAASVVAKGLGYMRTEGYQVLSDFGNNAREVDPITIDWRGVADGAIAAPRVRQLPGPKNFMGKVKFEFPNELGIYLHDTPDKQLLREQQRQFSSGCVRVADAPRLGRWLMRKPLPQKVGAPEQRIDLPELVPVYITYLTVAPENGRLAFRQDVYNRDGGLMALGSR